MPSARRQGPGMALFDALNKRLGAVPIMAEDLGVITSDVVALRCERWPRRSLTAGLLAPYQAELRVGRVGNAWRA